jgi:hypothetical protein
MTPPPAKMGGDALASTEGFFNEVCVWRSILGILVRSNSLIHHTYGSGRRRQRTDSQYQRPNRQNRRIA